MAEYTETGKLLVIGSAVADVIITLDHLPSRSEDVHVITQEMRLGGCAYNTYDMVRHFGVPAIPFFPIGQGAYGDFVRRSFQERKIHSPIPAPETENGCCYCFIEQDGERTFISYHGAEYRFEKEWFSLIDKGEVDSVYICGLEIEESTGVHIVAFLEELYAQKKAEKKPLCIYFAPGPRLEKIDPSLIQRLFHLQPILHLNETEAVSYTRQEISAGDSLQKAAAMLFDRTKAPVIITLGERGCCAYDGNSLTHAAPVSAVQIDTIGAGDAHIGAVMACRKLGNPLADALAIANRICAKVVSVHGALLSDEEFAMASVKNEG